MSHVVSSGLTGGQFRGATVLVNRFLRPLGLDATRTPIPGYHSLCDFAEALCPRANSLSLSPPLAEAFARG